MPIEFGGDPIVWAAWLYYEDSLNQSEVAERIAREGSLTAEDYASIREHLVRGNTDGGAIDALDDAHAEYERSDDPPKPPPEPLSMEW